MVKTLFSWSKRNSKKLEITLWAVLERHSLCRITALNCVNTIKSGMSQLIKNELPVYELFSGATLAFAAILLIIPGFATDLIGLLLIIPFTRKIILNKFIKRKNYKKKNDTEYIDGDYEDLSDDNDKKI